jgi:hypothetical protein
LRKVSLVVAAAATVLCFCAVALAQSANTNIYGVTGKIASGGTKKKPKNVGVVFNYTIKTPDGTLSTPVKTYKIHFNGLVGKPKNVAKGKYCSAATINAAASDAGCPAATHVGTGKVNALVGVAGTPSDPNQKCNLKLDIYAGGPTSLALYLHGQPPDCIAQIGQAIDAKLSTDATGGALSFSVPPVLLHPVTGLDVGITSVSSNISKGSGTKGVFTSTGCKGSRKVEVTFTTEAGTSGKASSSAGKC